MMEMVMIMMEINEREKRKEIEKMKKITEGNDRNKK